MLTRITRISYHTEIFYENVRKIIKENSRKTDYITIQTIEIETTQINHTDTNVINNRTGRRRRDSKRKIMRKRKQKQI